MTDYTPSTDEIRERAGEGCGFNPGLTEFDRWLAEHDRQVRSEQVPKRFAQHLVHEAIGAQARCELTAFPGEADYFEANRERRGQCTGRAVAVRWEGAFADIVCVQHAAAAEGRGAAVVYAKRHDGIESDQPPGGSDLL